jgi:CheY-like chemotaxis protein
VRTVFIIEDDPVVLLVYQAQFEKAGFDVRTATNGEESFYLLLHNSCPDAILLDLMLPKMSGVDVLKTIRAQRKFETIPIFVFTNNNLDDLAKEALEAGANQVFDKSKIVPGDLVDAVREFLAVSFQTVPGLPGEESTRTTVDEARETIAGLCKTLQALSKVEDQEKRLEHLSHLHEMIGELAEQARAIGLDSVSQMSTALEGLLKKLSENPSELSPSNLRTISYGIDFLDVLFKQSSAPDPAVAGPIRVLVVDDDDISRMAILTALERANLDSEGVENPQAALETLANHPFDLIFLDISMPEMSGFEVCQKLRKLPGHGKTPVIFVTSLNDFASRSQSKLIGGSDFIAKPFLFAELTVKALTYSFKHRLLLTPASIDQTSRANLKEGSPENSQSACLGSALSDLSVSPFATKDSNLPPAEESASSRASLDSRAVPPTDAILLTGVIRTRGSADEVKQTSVNSDVANHLLCGRSSKTRGIAESGQPNAIDASEIKGKPVIECEMASSTNFRAMLDREVDAGRELDLRCDELSRMCNGLEKDCDKHQKRAEALQEAVNRLETVLREKASEMEDVRSECQSERAQRKILEAQLAELSLSHASVREELNNRQEVPNDSKATSKSQRSSNEGTR